MEQVQVSSQPESDPTGSENSENSHAVEVRTRSGRVSKPPVRYEPVEQVEDDYSAEDYDTDEPESDDGDEDEDEEYTDDDDEDADEYGNLEGFVVPDKNESDDEDNERTPSSSVPIVKKRRV
jgi:hypothetical protein